MREIRLLGADDWEQYVTITSNAYPGFLAGSTATPEQMAQRAEEDQARDTVHLYGVFTDDGLVGLFRLHDFQMNFHGRMVPVGGLGGVAVDLVHKKKRVAYDIVQFYLEHYRQQGAFLTALYPFRPDFYKQMGFGYGPKLSQYRVDPRALPRDGARQQVRFLTAADLDAVYDCYHRLVARRHGLMAAPRVDLEKLLTSPRLLNVGYFAGDTLQGYLVFHFTRGNERNVLDNEFVIRDLVYENRAALRALLSFLHSQADQISRVVFNHFEEDFHLLLNDVRDDSGSLLPSVYHQSNVQGVGLMYRVIDLPALLEQYPLPAAAGELRLGISLTDSFYARQGGSWTLGVMDGRLHILPNAAPEITLTLDVAEFSSLVMGVTDLGTLVRYGLATLSDESALAPVSSWFNFPEKPICFTHF